MGKTIHEFNIPTKYLMINLQSTNSRVQEHVQCRQTTKFRAHDTKWFHSNQYHNLLYTSFLEDCWDAMFHIAFFLCFDIVDKLNHKL